MKQALNSFKETQSGWNGFLEHIKVHRPNEQDIKQFGYFGPEIKDLAIPWAVWEEQFSLDDQPVDVTFEKKLVQHLNSMRDRLNEGRNNGVAWLLNSSSFLIDVAEINQVCFGVMPNLRDTGRSIESYRLTEARVVAAETVALKDAVEKKLNWVEEQ